MERAREDTWAHAASVDAGGHDGPESVELFCDGIGAAVDLFIPVDDLIDTAVAIPGHLDQFGSGRKWKGFCLGGIVGGLGQGFFERGEFFFVVDETTAGRVVPF